MSRIGLIGEERALALLDTALAVAAADEVEISLAARQSSVLRFAGAIVHQPQDLAFLQLMVRATVAGRSARAATSSPALLPETVRRAAAVAAALAAAPPSGEPASGEADDALDARGAARGGAAGAGMAGSGGASLVFSSTTEWDAPARARALAPILSGARTTPARRELIGALAAGTTELAVGASSGLRRYGVASEASLSCTAEHDGGTSHAEELSRDAAALPDLGALSEQLFAEASAMRGAEELPPGSYDVVFGPQATAELIGFLPLLGFSAPALAAGIGVVARRDRRFAPLVSVVDDATNGPGLPFFFDCEGTSKRRVELIRRGEPAGVVSDRASGAVTGGSTGHAHVGREESPAPRAANLRLEAGSSSPRDLIAGLDSGVYVQRLWYTRVADAARGVITGTTRDAAFLVRDGALARPVGGTRFTESVLDALARVDAVASELHSQPVLNVWNGCATAPAIRVRGFRLGVASRGGR